MRIYIKTRVKGQVRSVIDRFDITLFEALAPKVGKLEIVEFTGSKTGDIVHIRFLRPIKAEWISHITEDAISEEEAYFVDEGRILPFPLTYWKHRHRVKKIDETSVHIIDDITYRGVNWLFTLLLYPALYFGFYPRKRIYKRYFK